jgi:hypothetical protein
MICNNCQKKNIIKAKFCQHCGSAFSDEERQKAYDRTIFGKIDKLEKWKGYITLDAITGHPIFKTAVLLFILLWGIFLGRSNGNQMLIMESNSYKVQQHITTGEFYVISDRDSVMLSLYLPRQTESVKLQAVVDGQVAQEQDFSAEEQPRLESGAAEYYYIVADYGDKTEQITVYLVKE